MISAQTELPLLPHRALGPAQSLALDTAQLLAALGIEWTAIRPSQPNPSLQRQDCSGVAGLADGSCQLSSLSHSTFIQLVPPTCQSFGKRKYLAEGEVQSVTRPLAYKMFGVFDANIRVLQLRKMHSRRALQLFLFKFQKNKEGFTNLPKDP